MKKLFSKIVDAYEFFCVLMVVIISTMIGIDLSDDYEDEW